MHNLNLKKTWIYFTPIFVSVVIALLILVLSNTLPPKIPLFYSLSWGEKQLANHQQLFIIPASIALVTLFNLIISWQLHHQQALLKKILFLSSVLVSLVLTTTFIKIILIFI